MATAAVLQASHPGLDSALGAAPVNDELYIRSNEGRIEGDRVGRMRETANDTPIEEIRKRLKEDGYVFVKGALPRQEVLNVRR